MKIDFANLKESHKAHQAEIEEAVLRVCRNAQFIMGSEVESLEKELAEFVGGGYAVSCSSGSSALLLSLMALGIKAGDEVITTPFTFIATSEMIALLGIKPVFDGDIKDRNAVVDFCGALVFEYFDNRTQNRVIKPQEFQEKVEAKFHER